MKTSTRYLLASAVDIMAGVDFIIAAPWVYYFLKNEPWEIPLFLGIIGVAIIFMGIFYCYRMYLREREIEATSQLKEEEGNTASMKQ